MLESLTAAGGRQAGRIEDVYSPPNPTTNGGVVRFLIAFRSVPDTMPKPVRDVPKRTFWR